MHKNLKLEYNLNPLIQSSYLGLPVKTNKLYYRDEYDKRILPGELSADTSSNRPCSCLGDNNTCKQPNWHMISSWNDSNR